MYRADTNPWYKKCNDSGDSVTNHTVEGEREWGGEKSGGRTEDKRTEGGGERGQ